MGEREREREGKRDGCCRPTCCQAIAFIQPTRRFVVDRWRSKVVVDKV